MLAAAVDAVRHFATHGDTASNQQLLHLIDHSLDTGGTNAAQTVAPQLLRWLLGDATACGAPSIALYVGVLNRHYCLQVVLNQLAQPLDRRPTGMAELQQLYMTALHGVVHDGTRRQLTQCLACLLIVLEDHLADQLRLWVTGGADAGAAVSPSSENECRLALHSYMAVIELLVDRRVPIGSIRRATQRRQLQEHLILVLQSPLRAVGDMPLLLRATDAAVRFLLEAMYGEPQEVAGAFWAALPTSAVWRYCLHCVSSAASPCPEAVLDFMCNVLRCLTLMDEAAEALLSGALPAVLQPKEPSAATAAADVDWEAISRVIAAALEASTEAIITEQPPDAPLFRLFSSAAERLVQVLQAPAAPATAVCHVCEGIGALTQVLQPAPIPEMEPTDDLEDFQEIVESMNASNATKRAALEQLRPFLHACELTLGTRLSQSRFTVAHWRTIAAYVAQHTSITDGEVEDYQIVHDDVELSLFTTYERLGRLLGPLTVEAIQSVAPDASQQLPLVMLDGALCLQWLVFVEEQSPHALLAQAALLPCTIARYAVRANADAAATTWTAEATLRVVDLFMHALPRYHVHNSNAGSSSSISTHERAAVLDLAEAAAGAVTAVQLAGFDAAELRQRCTPLATILWQCATSTSSTDAPALSRAARHNAALQLASLLQRAVTVLPDSAVTALSAQGAFTQAVLFASGGLTNPSMDTLDALTHTLRCLAQVSSEEAETAQTSVLCSWTERTKCHCAAADWPVESYAEMLNAWHEKAPQFLLCFLALACAVPTVPLRASLMMAGMTRFFSLPDSRDVSTPDLVALLTREHVQSIAAASTATATSLHALLQWLLQPHPSFTISDGGRRVRALAGCGCSLCDGGLISLPALTETLLMCVARWREYVAAAALSGAGAAADEALSADEDGELESTAEDDVHVRRAVLEELAVWCRCVVALPQLPADAPAWLTSLRCAQDDYERVEVLKNL